VTGFYEWVAWVNGGAWIETESSKVDILYRNLDQVRKTIRQAQQGIYQHDMETLGSFKILPEDYTNNILGILACPGVRRTELVSSVARLEVAWQSVACLAGFSHKPKY
jgi:hypothetical protein